MAGEVGMQMPGREEADPDRLDPRATLMNPYLQDLHIFHAGVQFKIESGRLLRTATSVTVLGSPSAEWLDSVP